MTEQDQFKNMLEAFKKMHDSASNTPLYTIVMSNQYLKELEKSGNFQESTMAKEVLTLRDDLRQAIKLIGDAWACQEPGDWQNEAWELIEKYRETDKITVSLSNGETMNSQNTDSDRIEVFKLTNEDWNGSYKIDGYYRGTTDNKLLKVSFFKLPPSTAPKEPPIWRTCVWGSDDFGMEYDAAMKEDAFARFMQVIRMEFVSKAALKDLGFVWA